MSLSVKSNSQQPTHGGEASFQHPVLERLVQVKNIANRAFNCLDCVYNAMPPGFYCAIPVLILAIPSPAASLAMFVSFTALWIILATRHGAYKCEILREKIKLDEQDLEIVKQLKSEMNTFGETIEACDSGDNIRTVTLKFAIDYKDKRKMLAERRDYFRCNFIAMPSSSEFEECLPLSNRDDLGLCKSYLKTRIKSCVETYDQMISGFNLFISTHKKQMADLGIKDQSPK